MAKRYCKFDEKGMGFQFNGCPCQDTLCFDCASNIPDGEEIDITDINKNIDKLEAEAENIKPIDDVLVKAAKAYVKTALYVQYEMTLSSDALMEDIWNGYDLLDAFEAGAEWYRSQLRKQYEEVLREINKKGLASFLINHRSNFIQDSNGDMMREDTDSL